MNLVSSIKARYFQVFNRDLNLDNPTYFTEKLQWLKINEAIPLKSLCADKYKVREYLKDKVDESIVVPLIHVFNRVDEVKDLDLNNKYVIRCNHGSEMNIFNVGKLNNMHIHLLTKWLTYDYSKRCLEPWYHDIERKILVEPFIDIRLEVKAFCFNGIPKIFQTLKYVNGRKVHNYYDTDWNFIKDLSRVGYKNDESHLDEKPDVKRLFEISSKLSKPFKFVRVDFIINNDNNIFCNELTFTPGGGFQFYKKNGDLILGNHLIL